VSLRAKFVIYLALIHLIFAGVCLLLLWDSKAWLLAVEGFFVVSFIAGVWLIRALFEPVRLIRSAVDFIKDHEFSTRLREVGQPELDPLIRVYNRMAEHLRQERIRSEEQEHFLQRIIAASPTGIVTLDLDGRIAMANPSAAALFRSKQEELQGRLLEELAIPLADRLALLPPGSTEMIPLQGRRRIRASVLTFMDRGFARRFILMDELTEELHRSEKSAYEKLIRMMSHEVNNTTGAVGSLLNSCLGYRDQLDEEDRKDFADALGIAISRTGRMNRFMQEFAEVVRLPAPRKRRCDPLRLLEEIEQLLREECGVRRIEWRWDVVDELPDVDMDPAQMEQAFINICRNGLEAIGEDGVITVRGGLDRDRPFIEINDNGGGIPEGIRDQLFTPFFTSKENGQGIGLTMVQEILLGHGFDFSLESGGDGTARFTILF
jgi:nitrogen fixation/metabolism regulation signal transduction histidine kinase